MAGLISKLQAVVDRLWDFFGRFAYPRVVALIFEGAVIGILGAVMLILAMVYPPLDAFGSVAVFVGIVTVGIGAFAYSALWVNSALQRRMA